MKRFKWTGLVAVAAVAAAAATASPALAASAPPGYTVVHGPELPVAPSTAQASATVGCPLGTVVWGGGAGFFNFPGPSLTVDGTGPFSAGTWMTDVDDRGQPRGDADHGDGELPREHGGAGRRRDLDIDLCGVAHAERLGAFAHRIPRESCGTRRVTTRR